MILALAIGGLLFVPARARLIAVAAQEPGKSGAQVSMTKDCPTGLASMNPHDGSVLFDVTLTDDGKAIYRGRRGLAALSGSGGLIRTAS